MITKSIESTTKTDRSHRSRRLSGDWQSRDIDAMDPQHGQSGRRVSVSFGMKYLLQAIITSAPLLVADIVALAISCYGAIAISGWIGVDEVTATSALLLWTSVIMQPMIGAV